MLQDGLIFPDGSLANNFQIQNGSTLPVSGNNVGELFYVQAGASKGLYAYDGTSWQQAGSAAAASYLAGAGITISNGVVSSPAYDIGLALPGLAGTGTVFITAVPRIFSLPANLTNSLAVSLVAATSATTISMYRKAADVVTSIGSINFSASSTAGTFTFPSSITFNVGDIFYCTIVTSDSTLADVAITLLGALA